MAASASSEGAGKFGGSKSSAQMPSPFPSSRTEHVSGAAAVQPAQPVPGSSQKCSAPTAEAPPKLPWGLSSSASNLCSLLSPFFPYVPSQGCQK